MRSNTSKNMVALDASKDEAGSCIDASNVFAISAQIVMTGTSSGTLNIQASNDIAPPVTTNGVPVPTNWSNIPTDGTVTITGTAGVFFIPKFDVAYRWIRSSFVHNNGSAGTISVNITTLGF